MSATNTVNSAVPTGLQQSPNIKQSFAGIIAPIIISVFAVYLTLGIAMGALPSFVKNDLGLNSLIIGLVIGLQSLATLLTRAYSGKLTDTKGAKVSNRYGVLLIVLSGIWYLTAAATAKYVWISLGFILAARIIHGVAESLSVTGALTWGIGLAGVQKSGKVMTWNGIAMYAGIAIGAPTAIWLKNALGITPVFLLIILLSVISWAFTVRLKELPPVDVLHVRTPFYKVVRQITVQGLGLAFSSVGFACISSFISLLFASRNWINPSMAFMTFGGCYILVRIFFSSFPDRFGGYKVALFSLIIEIIGQLLIGFSSSGVMAIAGCGLTGIGFSLIFPSLGVLAISKIAPQMRGTALGAYAAFFDLSLGLAGPIAGLIAGWLDYQAVYFFGAISCSLAVAILLLYRKR